MQNATVPSYEVKILSSDKIEPYLTYGEPVEEELDFTNTDKIRVPRWSLHDTKSSFYCGVEILSLEDDVTIFAGNEISTEHRFLTSLMTFHDLYYKCDKSKKSKVTYRDIYCERWLIDFLLRLLPYTDGDLTYSCGMAFSKKTYVPESETIKLQYRCTVPPSGVQKECVKMTVYCHQLSDLMKEIKVEWIWDYKSDSEWNNMVGMTFPPCKDYLIKTEYVDDFKKLCSTFNKPHFPTNIIDSGHPPYSTEEDRAKEKELTTKATDALYQLYQNVMEGRQPSRETLSLCYFI